MLMNKARVFKHSQSQKFLCKIKIEENPKHLLKQSAILTDIPALHNNSLFSIKWGNMNKFWFWFLSTTLEFLH